MQDWNLHALNPKPCMIPSPIVLVLFGIVYLTIKKSKPSYSSFKANIKKLSKCIDQITFGTTSTVTNDNIDEFIYY